MTIDKKKSSRRRPKPAIIYSDLYQKWREAFRTGNNQALAFYAKAHQDRFGPTAAPYDPEDFGPLASRLEPRQGRHIQ